ncbi:MAG: AMP-binding protein [Acidimicrobiia bacterium]
MSTRTAPSYPERTIPQLMLEAAERWGGEVAMRAKDRGVWKPLTWEAYAERVRAFALGLLELGLSPGENVAVLGSNRPEVLIADLSAQALGGAGVVLFVDSLPAEAAYVISHSDATVVVVEDQEQADKVLEARADLPGVRKVVFWDPRGMGIYDDPLLIPFTAVEDLGRERGQRAPSEFEEHVARGRPDDLAILLYTSGTTGKPKGAMISHRNAVAGVANLFAAGPVPKGAERLAFLPLAWAGERFFSTAAHALFGHRLNFAEEPETLRTDIREIGPHHLLGAPRMWEDYVSGVEVKMMEATWLKRRIYRWAQPLGQRRAARFYRDEPMPFGLRARVALADFLVFRPIRDHLGLLRCPRVYSGGAALGPDVLRWFHALGIPLKQIYGSTEVGIIVMHLDKVKPETMGQTVPGVELAISESGEILIRADSVFLGYYKNPEATAAVFGDGGWAHTGDEGFLDPEGHLVVLDRAKNVSRLSGGERFSPTFIENKLKFSPYVKEAVCFGDGRDRVVALVNIDAETVGKWAESQRIPYTTYTDLTQRAPVCELLLGEVARVNTDLPEGLRVARFCILHKELDADDEEITRTRKVRRGLVAERYKFIVDALYGGAGELPVEAEVAYRDGRKARVRTTLRLIDTAVPTPAATVVG